VRNKCCGLDVAGGGGERQGEANSQHSVYLLGLPRGKHAGVRCTQYAVQDMRGQVFKSLAFAAWVAEPHVYIRIYRIFKDIQLCVFTIILVTLGSTRQESSPELFDSEQAFVGDMRCDSLRLNTSKPTINNTIVQAPDRTNK
jgi:hypothetical protein